MRTQKVVGLLLAVGGAGVLGFLFYQSIDGSFERHAFYALGMPGALLLGMVAMIVLAYGGHLLAQRPTSSRELTPPARRHK
jgi:hypothetical protein